MSDTLWNWCVFAIETVSLLFAFLSRRVAQGITKLTRSTATPSAAPTVTLRSRTPTT